MRNFMKVTAKREKAGHMRFAVLMLVTLLATAMPFSVFAETYDVVSQFRTKGRVQVGADADIVVFNPDTVTDNSTYEPGMGALPSTGIPYVLVNGRTQDV